MYYVHTPTKAESRREWSDVQFECRCPPQSLFLHGYWIESEERKCGKTVGESLCLHCNWQGYSWGDFCRTHESPLRCHGKDLPGFQVDEDWGCGLHSPTTKQLAHQARWQFTPCHHRLTQLFIGSGKRSNICVGKSHSPGFYMLVKWSFGNKRKKMKKKIRDLSMVNASVWRFSRDIQTIHCLIDPGQAVLY